MSVRMQNDVYSEKFGQVIDFRLWRILDCCSDCDNFKKWWTCIENMIKTYPHYLDIFCYFLMLNIECKDIRCCKCREFDCDLAKGFW